MSPPSALLDKNGDQLRTRLEALTSLSMMDGMIDIRDRSVDGDDIEFDRHLLNVESLSLGDAPSNLTTSEMNGLMSSMPNVKHLCVDGAFPSLSLAHMVRAMPRLASIHLGSSWSSSCLQFTEQDISQLLCLRRLRKLSVPEEVMGADLGERFYSRFHKVDFVLERLVRKEGEEGTNEGCSIS